KRNALEQRGPLRFPLTLTRYADAWYAVIPGCPAVRRALSEQAPAFFSQIFKLIEAVENRGRLCGIAKAFVGALFGFMQGGPILDIDGFTLFVRMWYSYCLDTVTLGVTHSVPL